MLKKKGRHVRSMTAVTAVLVISFIIVWAGSMLLTTFSAARQLHMRMYAECSDFAASVGRQSLYRFYDSGHNEYGLNKDRSDLADYAMLDAIAVNNDINFYSIQDPEESWPLADIKFPVQTAVLFYDSEGKIVHKSGDYIYFNYLTQKEWEEGEETAGAGGWIDLNAEDAREKYARFYVQYAGTKNLHNFIALRITGNMNGAKIIPVKLDFIIEDEDLWSLSLSEADRNGKLFWQNQFDDSGEVKNEDELVTIYALHPQMSVYEKNALRYYTWDESIDSLEALLEELDFPAVSSGENLQAYFQGMSESSLNRILLFGGSAYRDYEPGSEEAPPVDYYLVTAIMCFPLKGAAAMLWKVYLYSGLLMIILLFICRNALKKQLVKPLKDITEGMCEGWSRVYPPENNTLLWKEPELLREYYEKERSRRQDDRIEKQRLETALSYAENAERLRRETISAMAHELKTPLAVIHGCAEGLRENIAADKKERYTDMILSEAERMDSMVMEMLDLSRLEAGKVKLSIAEFSLNELIRETAERLSPLAAERRLNVSMELSENIIVAADEARLGQAVENLISNAYRYCPEEGTVVTGCGLKGKEAEFFVENSVSKALTSEELDRVWDTYYKADKARTGKGTGLGLAIVKNIIELHGGTCRVQNTDGGVRFSFRISV